MLVTKTGHRWSEKGFVYFFFYLLRTGRNFSKEKRGIERERKMTRIFPFFFLLFSFLNNKSCDWWFEWHNKNSWAISTHHKWSIEHDSPFVDDPYGVEPLANYHKSQVTRMKAKTKSGNDLPIVLLPYSSNHLTI